MLMELPRRCIKCGEHKPVSDFYLHYGKPRTDCKACNIKSHSEYAKKHRARLSKKRRFRTLRQFGITPEIFTALLDAQAHRCQICECHIGDAGARKYDRAYVDHDHTTGKVRGLLCCRCNLCIGQWGDNPRLVDAAAAYLRKHGKS